MGTLTRVPAGAAMRRRGVAVRRVRALLLALAAWLATSALGVTFPVARSADGRTLVDATGAPFPILGRTAWFVTSLPQADYELFLDDCAAKDYTAFEFHVINHDPRGNTEPFAGNGQLPFLTTIAGDPWAGNLSYADIATDAPDLTAPNEAYWAHVDALLAHAESRGLLAFMFPAYVGYAGGEQGWMQELVANGPARARAYGAWIATRYAARGNIVWMMGGDMGTGGNPFDAAQTAVELALLDGLQGPGQQSTFFSAEWNSESIGTDQPDLGAAMSLNGAYSFSGYSAAHCRRAYAFAPPEPAYLLEEPYDEEGPDGNGVNGNATQPVRRFQWWGWLSSIGGYISGNGYVWPFNAPWRTHLDTQGAQDMARLNAFVKSIEWQDLVPSELGGMRAIVTAGGSQEFLDDYVAAAATPDGTLLVAYVPPDHVGSITIDMATLSAPARARWLDPTTAAYTDIGSDLPNIGTLDLTPPGANASGFADWVLVIDVPPPPGCAATLPVGATLRVSRPDAARVRLDWLGPVDPCFASFRMRRASTARPAVGAGSFPVDPAFADITADDADGSALDATFTHAATPGTDELYLVTLVGTDGTEGPAEAYGR